MGIFIGYVSFREGNKIAGGFFVGGMLVFGEFFVRVKYFDDQSLEFLSLPITDTGWWFQMFLECSPRTLGFHDPIRGLVQLGKV